MEKKSSVYFVSTPIGNIKDITFRAIEILKLSDIIYCEDTRNSKKLLNYYGIDTKVSSYHKFNENERISEIVSETQKGKIVSIISDAGMPIINDPGYIILKELIEREISFEILPGACALINGICGSGYDSSEFIYMGFVPKTNSEREKYFEKFIKSGVTGIFYESPHRLLKTLEFLKNKFGEINICVCRELTKLYEEYKRGNISSVIEYFEEKGVKGEIVIVIEKIDFVEEEIDYYKKIEELLNHGYRNKEIVNILKKEYKISKNEAYSLVLEINKGDD